MEKHLLAILEDGGLVGALVVFAVLAVGFVLRYKGWLFSERKNVVSSTQLGELTTEVQALKARVGQVEEDVLKLPSRDDLHKLELAHAEMFGKINLLEETGKATQAGVIRIETYLINLSQGAAK
ncbi:Protein of unknown function [Aliiroseovarius crassostreae]|uniref:Uncharacterized protein n=1 Tax=Aliiroseovarius crassostreae TaxID=154981 RepID=A0A0P7KK81_9RHOB|nr:DUF2730 family protein [Aliiroseovarius crassostreae]KPN64269.1 hypothetical protein AKJ29_16685 [Aliiroseovarius crassostreae]SFU31381.1 Protein of unknown function [Aliiroseovarius crassostreae]